MITEFFFSSDTKHQHQLKLGDEIKLSKMCLSCLRGVIVYNGVTFINNDIMINNISVDSSLLNRGNGK